MEFGVVGKLFIEVGYVIYIRDIGTYSVTYSVNYVMYFWLDNASTIS